MTIIYIKDQLSKTSPSNMSFNPPRNTFKEYGQLLHGFFPGKPTYTEKDYPTLDGKVVLITGASTGVGYQTAKSLAALTNAKIYILSRSVEKSLEAIKRIEIEVAQEYKKKIDKITFIQIDLSDLTTIKPAVEEFLAQEDRLDIIIHNAGLHYPNWDGLKTKQGHEIQLGTNAIGPHLLQKLLDPIFIKSVVPNESRIVWVSSTGQLSSPKGGLNLDDPNLEKTKSAMLAYSQSKALNAIQARWWPRVHEIEGAVSVSLCPGLLDSELSRHYSSVQKWFLSKMLHPVRKGAYSELFAALSPEVTAEKNGEHIISFGKFGFLREDLKDDVGNEKVWEFLEKAVEPYV